YTTARNVLQQEFYHVKPLSIFGDDPVPKDAATIVIAGARRDLRPEESLKLDEYLRGGGSLLVLVDPGDSPSLGAFLRRYRIDLPSAIVADYDNRLAASEPLTARLSDRSRESSVTSILDADPVFSLFRPIDVLPGDDEDLDVLPLLTTSKNSWAIATQGTAVPENLDFDERRGDRKGPFLSGVSVAVKLANPVELAEDESAPRAGRLIVYGDVDFANNFFIDLGGSRDLWVNSVNWLALEDTLIGVRPERKVSGKEQFYVSGRQNRMVFLLGVIVQPAIFLLLGVAVFVRRRLN
ncbi:MAG: Gldg family protein, partial [Candidatus Binatia bacterium]